MSTRTVFLFSLIFLLSLLLLLEFLLVVFVCFLRSQGFIGCNWPSLTFPVGNPGSTNYHAYQDHWNQWSVFSFLLSMRIFFTLPEMTVRPNGRCQSGRIWKGRSLLLLLGSSVPSKDTSTHKTAGCLYSHVNFVVRYLHCISSRVVIASTQASSLSSLP